jgi:hypothetical protein
MTITTDPAARAAFIAGLRELADHLTANPTVPVPSHTVEIKLIPVGDDAHCEGVVDAFAAALDVSVLDRRAGCGEYGAQRAFGPVVYRTFTYTAASMAEHHAQQSYAGCIQTRSAAAPAAEIAEAA